MNDLKSREEELKALKKENRKRRKVIEAYQDMINAGATGLHAVRNMFSTVCVTTKLFSVSCVQERVC